MTCNEEYDGLTSPECKRRYGIRSLSGEAQKISKRENVVDGYGWTLEPIKVRSEDVKED